MRKIIEQRRGLRFPGKEPVGIITEEKIAYKGTITDKSSWGAFITTKKPFLVGQNITIALLSSDNKIKVKKKARVMRVAADGIGIKYEKADFSLNPPSRF